MKKYPILALLLAMVLALGLTSCGSEKKDDDPAATDDAAGISVSDPWVRATAGTEDPTMTAVFMAITNGTDADVTLLSATSPGIEMVQVHEMVEGDDGHMMMQEAPDGVTIRAGKEQLLMPGGYHVMLMGLADEIAPGDEIELTLTFSDGTTVDVTAPAKEYTEEEGHYHSHSASPGDEMSMDPSASSSM
jgi:hypothetical protein